MEEMDDEADEESEVTVALEPADDVVLQMQKRLQSAPVLVSRQRGSKTPRIGTLVVNWRCSNSQSTKSLQDRWKTDVCKYSW